MKQYIKHESRWDATNPVAIFSKERKDNGYLKIVAAISIKGGKVEEGDLIESNYLATSITKVYQVTQLERFTPKGNWIIPNDNIGIIAHITPFTQDIEKYLENN